MALVLTWPVGRAAEGDRAAGPPGAPVAAYVFGSSVGAGLVALALAATASLVARLSALLDVLLVSAVVSLALGAVVMQWKGRVRPFPERRAQVPRGWLMWRSRTLTGTAYGLMIGAAVFTHLRHASIYVLASLIVLAPSVAAGALIGGMYGTLRGLTLAIDWIRDRRVRKRSTWFQAGDSKSLNAALAVAAAISLALGLTLTY